MCVWVGGSVCAVMLFYVYITSITDYYSYTQFLVLLFYYLSEQFEAYFELFHCSPLGTLAEVTIKESKRNKCYY